MLSPLDAALVSDVIEECLSQVRIIGQLSEIESSQKIKQSVTNVAVTSDKSPNDEDEDDDFLYSVVELTPEEKLNMDRKAIEMALGDCLQEMRTERSYKTLAEFVRDYKRQRKDYEEFRRRALEECKNIPKIQKGIANAKSEMQKEVDDMDNYIAQLNFEFQKLKARTEMEKQYVRELTRNEVEQAAKKCSLSEEEIRSNIQRLEKRLHLEKEADEEISEYFKLKEEELLKVLNYWKYKFFDDMKLKEKELATVKKYKALNLEKIAVVSRKLQTANDYLEQDRKQKDKEREIREQEIKKANAIVSVQAWWRGTMVRNKLGPYAEKKKEKKKKKEGKKGKKK